MEEEKKEEKLVEEITLIIKFNFKTKGISLNGPLRQEMLCIWLLEKVKDMIKEINKPVQTIVPAKGPIPPFMKREN